MRKKLLLADDSLTIQRVIEQTFADEAIDVVTVSDGAAAVARLGDDPPDVLLADIGMPGCDGYEVALHVRRTPALAHIPVILLTGALDPVDHARAREAGCAGVLVKPFDPQMLIARVRHLLEGRSPARVGSGDAPAGRETGAPGVDLGFAAGPDGARPADEETSPPAASADSRAAAVDDYFARLDRAFATLQTAAPGSTADAMTIGSPAGPPAMSSPYMEAREPDSAPAISKHAAPPTVPQADSRPAPAPGMPIAGPQAAGEPTLGDAFGVLLAIEQGQPVPEGARWASVVTPHLVEQVARIVSREISERVVRDLAPDIISQIAERLVREELARVTSGRERG